MNPEPVTTTRALVNETVILAFFQLPDACVAEMKLEAQKNNLHWLTYLNDLYREFLLTTDESASPNGA